MFIGILPCFIIIVLCPGRAKKTGNDMRYRHVDALCDASDWRQLLSWKM